MRTLDDVVDDLGLGFGQYIVVLLGGELYSGLIKTLVTSCSVAFASDLGFSATERGWMVSTLFLGNFAGNLSSGAISDCCGRRFTILVGYLVGVSALLASLLTLLVNWLVERGMAWLLASWARHLGLYLGSWLRPRGGCGCIH